MRNHWYQSSMVPHQQLLPQRARALSRCCLASRTSRRSSLKPSPRSSYGPLSAASPRYGSTAGEYHVHWYHGTRPCLKRMMPQQDVETLTSERALAGPPRARTPPPLLYYGLAGSPTPRALPLASERSQRDFVTILQYRSSSVVFAYMP
jgi:hypothetical protein